MSCVTCTISLKIRKKKCDRRCDVSCYRCNVLIFRCKGIFGEKTTSNLESHKFLSQVLASVRPVIATGKPVSQYCLLQLRKTKANQNKIEPNKRCEYVKG